MNIINKKAFSVVVPETETVSELVNILSTQFPKELADKNLIINLLDFTTLSKEEILQFLPISEKHVKTKKSFVVVNDAISIDDIPENLTVVPTLLEAGDIIEMEEIERALGF
jgi:hypothetical protein